MLIMKERDDENSSLFYKRNQNKEKFLTQKELGYAESKEDDIEITIKILFDILEKIYTTHFQFPANIENKDNINSDYLNRYFSIFIKN